MKKSRKYFLKSVPKCPPNSFVDEFLTLRTLDFAIPYCLFNGFSLFQGIASKTPSKPQNIPKYLQNTPKISPKPSQEAPKIPPRGPKSTHGGRKLTQRSSKIAKRGLQEPPRLRKSAPRVDFGASGSRFWSTQG